MPGTLYLATLKTYIDYLPIHNFWIIPGEKDGKPFYGLNAFIYMVNYMLALNTFDYVIYIDEDCFITDFEQLIEEFKKFKDNGYCLGGPMDGGVFCHRNHSRYMINTFLSFWNIKLLRDNNITQETLLNYYNTVLANQHTALKDFIVDLQLNNAEIYNKMNISSLDVIAKMSTYREKHFPKEGIAYAETVKDDKNNNIERYQVPYSYSDDKETFNFEPYYLIEQAFVKLTKSSIYYFAATDFYDKEFDEPDLKSKLDISGLSSAVYTNDKKCSKLIAVHSWYSRAYTKWPKAQVQLDQTKRINTLIKKFSKI